MSLSPSQAAVLGIILEHGPLNSRKIIEMSSYTRGTVEGILPLLTNEGLVRRYKSVYSVPEDMKNTARQRIAKAKTNSKR